MCWARHTVHSATALDAAFLQHAGHACVLLECVTVYCSLSPEGLLSHHQSCDLQVRPVSFTPSLLGSFLPTQAVTTPIVAGDNPSKGPSLTDCQVLFSR